MSKVHQVDLEHMAFRMCIVHLIYIKLCLDSKAKVEPRVYDELKFIMDRMRNAEEHVAHENFRILSDLICVLGLAKHLAHLVPDGVFQRMQRKSDKS